jgi:hypothetical protein
MANATSRHIEPLLPGGDAAVIRVSIGLTATEGADIGSIRTFPVTVTPAFADYYPVDAGSVSIKVTLSRLDVADIHDANTILVTVTNLSVENPQFQLVESPQWYVDVQFSGSDLYAKQYTDSGAAYVDVQFSGVDCYNIATPNYLVIDYKRWDVGSGSNRWASTELGKRWNVFEVVGNFDNSCFATTVA